MHHAALATMMPRVAAVALPAIQMSENLKAPLLAVVEALVKRSGCVSDLLQRRAAFCHPFSPQLQTLDRITRPVCTCTRRETIRTHLGLIAQRLLKRRPVLLLIGRQLESGLERGNTRICHCAAILLTHMPAMMCTRAAVAALLRIHERTAGKRKYRHTG
jgi:hypothetical protein